MSAPNDPAQTSATLCAVCDGPGDAGGGGMCPECQQLLRWFRSYFADVPTLDLRSITPRTRLVEDLGLDSLDYVDWVLEAESVFGVHIPTADAERMRTVRDYLSRLRREGARWLPHQEIAIVKKRWGRREWKVVVRDDPRLG